MINIHHYYVPTYLYQNIILVNFELFYWQAFQVIVDNVKRSDVSSMMNEESYIANFIGATIFRMLQMKMKNRL